jgi:hypothetical protein
LDIYATKREALAERAAEKREKAKTVHLRSVTGPEVDRPIVLPRVVPAASVPMPESVPSELPAVPPEIPGGRDIAEVLSDEAEQRIETFGKVSGQTQDPEPGVAVPPAPLAPEPPDAEAIAALKGATSLRPIFNLFMDKGITDAEGLFAACVRIKEHVPYMASMINFEKRVRTALAVILEKDSVPQAFS